MGFFSKFKKSKDPDFDTLADKEINDYQDPLAVDDSPSLSADPAYRSADLLTPPQNSASPFPSQQFQINNELKDLELINSKLDTLKALLYSIDRRLETIERQSGQEQKNRLW